MNILQKTLLKIVFKMLRLPLPRDVDTPRMRKWLGDIYPTKEFRDYISGRNQTLLQILGEGIERDEDYLIKVGQRLELSNLLTQAKLNFENNEKERKQKSENSKNK